MKFPRRNAQVSTSDAIEVKKTLKATTKTNVGKTRVTIESSRRKKKEGNKAPKLNDNSNNNNNNI